jgi:5-formyltetrahydrofolate cyclo-ligase
MAKKPRCGKPCGRSGRPSPRGAVVAAYVPMGTEMSPEDLMFHLQDKSDFEARDYTFVLPRTPPKGSGLPLRFHLRPPVEALERSAFGVLEPPAGQPVFEPDLLLVPLLGFDRRGYRIGYGAGHYDRTLADLRARKPITAVGLAWAAQEVERIPIGAFDERLDWVVTEKEAIGPL